MAKKILIIEDDEDTRLFLKNILDADGYKTIGVRDGTDGLTKVWDVKPDLVIIDAMLPEESGIHLYRQMRLDSSLKKIPVIMMATLDKRTLRRAHRLGATFASRPWLAEPDAYLSKPPEADELLSLVRGFFSISGNGAAEGS